MPRKIDPVADLEAAKAAFEEEYYGAAIALLEPLCLAGIPEAKSVLGVFYQLGLGVPVNGPKAIELLLSAAESGIGAAAHNLGTIYANGLPGITPDRERSKTYYRLARKLGAQVAPDDFYE